MTLQEAIRNASTHTHQRNSVGGQTKMWIYASAPFTHDSEARYDPFGKYFNLDMCMFASCEDVSNKLMDALSDYGDNPELILDKERINEMAEGIIASIIDDVERDRGEQNAESSERRFLLSYEKAVKRAEYLTSKEMVNA